MIDIGQIYFFSIKVRDALGSIPHHAVIKIIIENVHYHRPPPPSGGGGGGGGESGDLTGEYYRTRHLWTSIKLARNLGNRVGNFTLYVKFFLRKLYVKFFFFRSNNNNNNNNDQISMHKK